MRVLTTSARCFFLFFCFVFGKDSSSLFRPSCWNTTIPYLVQRRPSNMITRPIAVFLISFVLSGLPSSWSFSRVVVTSNGRKNPPPTFRLASSSSSCNKNNDENAVLATNIPAAAAGSSSKRNNNNNNSNTDGITDDDSLTVIAGAVEDCEATADSSDLYRALQDRVEAMDRGIGKRYVCRTQKGFLNIHQEPGDPYNSHNIVGQLHEGDIVTSTAPPRGPWVRHDRGGWSIAIFGGFTWLQELKE